MSLRFPLSLNLGTLAGGLGSFPLDYETHLPQSDSRALECRHSEFGWVW
jgi:hypothetical protein